MKSKMNTVGPDKRLHYHRLTPDEVIAELKSHRMGLTNADAKRRLLEHGPNEIDWPQGSPHLSVLIRQLKNPITTLLALAAAVALYAQSDTAATAFAVLALMNVCASLMLERRVDMQPALDGLPPSRAKVVRNDIVQWIDARTLVVGDIVQLAEEDAVPADIRLIEAQQLATDDTPLGGTSFNRKFTHAVGATIPVAERHNLVCMGSRVVNGSGRGVVVAIGPHTELGRAAAMYHAISADTHTPQNALHRIALRVAQAYIGSIALLVITALAGGFSANTTVLFALAITAAIIPSSLAAVIVLIAMQTSQRLAGVRVNHPEAVGLLGTVDVMFADMPGFLTKNEPSVAQIVVGREAYLVHGTGYAPKGAIMDEHSRKLNRNELDKLSLFFTASALAVSAKVCPPDSRHDQWYVHGDPSEGAIITMARKGGINTEMLDSTNPCVEELAFDAGRKLGSTIRHYDDGLALFVQGAPDAVIARCKKLWDHGHERSLTKNDAAFFTNFAAAEAQQARHTVAIAYRTLPKSTTAGTFDMEKIEQGLTFLGIVSLHDPLYEAVPASIHTAKAAHIAISFLSNDTPAVARALAARAHLAAPGENITSITAAELANLTDDQVLAQIAQGKVVFCGLSPEDKLRLVEIAKFGGHTVAVTGSGAGDQPALKRADVGIALGTDSTVGNLADIVLSTGGFDALIHAIRQGRTAHTGIYRAIRSALTDAAAVSCIVLIGIAGFLFLHIPPAITVLQVIGLIILVQLLPLAALGADKAEPGSMHRGPERTDTALLDISAIREIILFGLLAALLAYGNFLLFFVRQGLSPSYIDASSMLAAQAMALAFLTLALCELVNIYFVRANRHSRFFGTHLLSNKFLLASAALSVLCILALLYNPALQSFFGTQALTPADWLTAVGAAVLYASFRLLQRYTRKHAHHVVIKLHREVLTSHVGQTVHLPK